LDFDADSIVRITHSGRGLGELDFDADSADSIVRITHTREGTWGRDLGASNPLPDLGEGFGSLKPAPDQSDAVVLNAASRRSASSGIQGSTE
jgi:hypothetical protein